MPMNIRKITENEREQLHQLISCSDETITRRARAVLMASDGMDAVAIAQSLSISERIVRYAVKRFNDGGMEALGHRVSPGRPRSVSEQERELLIAVIRRSPEEFGMHTEQWNLADLIIAAGSEGVLLDVSSWTLQREAVRLIDLHPDLQDRVNIANQEQPGAPLGNRNAVKHGGYAEGKPSPEELALIVDIEACFLRDFPDSDEDDIKLIRTIAEAFLMTNRALAADCADAAMRAGRRFRKAIQTLEARKRQRSNKQTTPADWATNLLKQFGRE